MSDHNDALYFKHIVDACNRIGRFTEGVTWAAFVANEEKQSAVIRQLEIIGEAGGHISSAGRAAYPHIPWRALRATRNLLIHGYANVDLRRVWEIAKRQVPTLGTAVRDVLAAHNAQPER